MEMCSLLLPSEFHGSCMYLTGSLSAVHISGPCMTFLTSPTKKSPQWMCRVCKVMDVHMAHYIWKWGIMWNVKQMLILFHRHWCQHLCSAEGSICVCLRAHGQPQLRGRLPINTCFVPVNASRHGEEMMASVKEERETKRGGWGRKGAGVAFIREREELVWDEHIRLFIRLIYFQPSGFMVIGKALPARSFPEGVDISPSPSFLPLFL